MALLVVFEAEFSTAHDRSLRWNTDLFERWLQQPSKTFGFMNVMLKT